jgi:beta-phosphoglucomutase
MHKPLAFIFDLDGVLTDTSEYHFLAWKRLADEEGISFTREDNEQLRGVSRRESLARMLKGRPIDEATAAEWMERKNNYYVEYLTQITPDNLLPGVGDFLQEAKAHGIRLGIGSASKNARTVLERLEILDTLDAIGDGHSVAHSKPAPDLFVWVAGRLNVPSPQCIVFEDAEAGVQAAQAAGMHCVGIGPSERVGEADLACEGLGAISIESVLSLMD